MQKKVLNQYAIFLTACALLPSCALLEWFQDDQKKDVAGPLVKKGSGDAKDVVASIAGEPLLFKDEMDAYVEAALSQQPALKQVVGGMPAEQQKALYQQILDEVLRSRLLQHYVSLQGWDQSKQYQQDLERLMKQVENTLAMQTFQNNELAKINVSDREAERLYKKERAENKYFMQEPFLKAPAQVQTIGIKVGSQEEAQDIVAQASKQRSLRAVAKNLGKTVKDFGGVSSQSQNVDRMIMIHALNMSEFPSFQAVQTQSGEYWVIAGVKKEGPEFVPFDSVKEAVRNYIMSQRLRERVEQVVKDLHEKEDVVVNEAIISSYVVENESSAPQEDEAPEQEQVENQVELPLDTAK